MTIQVDFNPWYIWGHFWLHINFLSRHCILANNSERNLIHKLLRAPKCEHNNSLIRFISFRIHLNSTNSRHALHFHKQFKNFRFYLQNAFRLYAHILRMHNISIYIILCLCRKHVSSDGWHKRVCPTFHVHFLKGLLQSIKRRKIVCQVVLSIYFFVRQSGKHFGKKETERKPIEHRQGVIDLSHVLIALSSASSYVTWMSSLNERNEMEER